MPMAWVPRPDVEERVAGRSRDPFFICFSNITSPTNERSLTPSLVPLAGVGNSLPIILTDRSPLAMLAALSSLIVDYSIRQKLGGVNMNFFYVEQIPMPAPDSFSQPCPWDRAGLLQKWIENRVEELIYTAWDMATAAQALNDPNPPFVWNPVRRSGLRAELDAAFFHLFGLARDDTEYVLSTFPILRRKDPELVGRVLAAYDAMAKAIESGSRFVSTLHPPPGQGRRHPENL